MQTGRIVAIHKDEGGGNTLTLDAPISESLTPGQYLLINIPDQPDAVFSLPLFPGGIHTQTWVPGFPTPKPDAWIPGTTITLRGPLGSGFRPPREATRFALAAFGNTSSRLLPLTGLALQKNCAVALFTNAPQPSLPPAIEIQPLEALPTALSWADYLAVDIPYSQLTLLHSYLPGTSEGPLPCVAQALIIMPMPCGGIADCGACAVPTRKGYKLACKDGPVFDLNEVDW
ncbi:MAG: hypothetical protein AB1345_13315 [Chloroflexota bacterium]